MKHFFKHKHLFFMKYLFFTLLITATLFTSCKKDSTLEKAGCTDENSLTMDGLTSSFNVLTECYLSTMNSDIHITDVVESFDHANGLEVTWINLHVDKLNGEVAMPDPFVSTVLDVYAALEVDGKTYVAEEGTIMHVSTDSNGVTTKCIKGTFYKIDKTSFLEISITIIC